MPDRRAHENANRAHRASELEIGEARFRSYFELGLIGMAISSPEKGWLEVNGRLCELLGYPRDELVTKTRPEVTHPDDLAADEREFNRVLSGEIDGYSLEKRYIRKDGNLIHAKVDLKCVRRADGAIDQFVVLVQDITDRKRVEQELRQAHDELDQRVRERTAELTRSEERWRSLVETAPDIILTIDSSGTILYINRVEHGFDAKKLRGTSAYDYVWPQFRDEYRNCVESVLRTGQPANFEVALDSPDGQSLWYFLRMGPLRNQNQVVGVTIIATDITARKKTEISLTESEQLFRSTFEQAAVGMAQVSPEGRFLRVNQTLSKFLGYSPAELLACTFQEITHPDDLDADLQRVRQFLAGEIDTYSMEKRYYRKDRSIVWANLTVALVRDAARTPKYFISVVEDISQRKQAEEKLKAEERLLRRLLELQENERRMVAHDIHDGFVQYVVGAHFQVQAIQGELDSAAIEAHVDNVGALLQKAIDEGRRLIRDLRPMVLDERGVVEAIEHLIADEQKHGSLVTVFQHDVQFDRLEPRLEVAVFRIVQEALTNVRHHARTNHAALQLTQAGHTLHIVVRDSGIGFDPSQVSPDRFGLSGIRERARLFGGVSQIESAPGEGTVVSVQLPLQLDA